MPRPAAGEEPRWNRNRRIARPETERLRQGRADTAEAGYLEDVGRRGAGLASAASARPIPPAPRHAQS